MPVSWESGWRFCATGSCREGICALIARPSGESALSVGQLYREEGWLTKRMGKERKEGLPYEKFMRMGAEALTDAVLLAILLRTGPAPGREAAASHRDCPALGLAETLLSLPENARGGIAGLAQLSVPQLMQVKGIGEVKAVRICCLSEFARRFGLEQSGRCRRFLTRRVRRVTAGRSLKEALERWKRWSCCFWIRKAGFCTKWSSP